MAQVNNPALLNSIAILIDADNASAKTIDTVFAHIKTLGKISCKKIYGDWGQDNLKGWQAVILRHAIDPMQQFAYVKGKNATDIALVIEAMDLLYSGKYDGFCLVSSDSDFASLAVRIRKSGLPVYGFGGETAVESFRISCDRFFEVETFVDSKKTNKPTTQETTKSSLHTSTTQQKNISNTAKLIPSVLPANANISSAKPITPLPKTVAPWDGKKLKCDTKLLNTLRSIIKDSPYKQAGGWVNYANVAQHFKNDFNIDIKKYGYDKLIQLIEAIDIFEKNVSSTTFFVRDKSEVNYSPPNVNKAIQKEIDLPNPTKLVDSSNTHSIIQPLILTDKITVKIFASQGFDCILLRLNEQQKVRDNSDIIFYGQTQSEDNTLSLIHHEFIPEYISQNQLLAKFDCDLVQQASEITNLAFIITSDTPLLQHQPLIVRIEQHGKNLFEQDLSVAILENDTILSILLCELTRHKKAWKFHARSQAFSADLRQICQQVGIEVSDD